MTDTTFKPIPVLDYVHDLTRTEVQVPSYDRDRLTTGVVHFGVGGFHRAHQAMYLDRLLQAGSAREFAICGVGVLPADQRMRDVMSDQRGLYTLVVRYPDGREDARVIGSLREYLFAPDDPDAVIEKVAHPATRIVSLTITEGGYNIDALTAAFDGEAPAIVADLAAEHPSTVFGLVAEACRRRRDRGLPGFTLMSCDNIAGNGHVAERSFTAYASLVDPTLADWMRSNLSFPNSMVDRITPVTTPADIGEVAARFGISDGWPVVCEDFEQWVLEDNFVGGRPPYEQAGVQLVDDVEPYELMKLRLLNASHQALAYVSALAGETLVHEAMGQPVLVQFLQRYMGEAVTTLPPVPGIDLDGYRRTLLVRFANPHVRDTVARLAAETSDRIPKWLLPTVRDRLAAGESVIAGAAIVASWARYLEVAGADGSIQVVDARKDELIAAARPAADPLAFLRIENLFGDLANQSAFTGPYLDALQALRAVGPWETLARLPQ